MIGLEMRNCNITEKQHKYQHFHPEKLIIINILQVKKHFHLIKAE